MVKEKEFKTAAEMKSFTERSTSSFQEMLEMMYKAIEHSASNGEFDCTISCKEKDVSFIKIGDFLAKKGFFVMASVEDGIVTFEIDWSEDLQPIKLRK